MGESDYCTSIFILVDRIRKFDQRAEEGMRLVVNSSLLRVQGKKGLN